jgi:hypothetical protein
VPIPGKVEDERVHPSRPLPVLAPRSALELLPSRALSSAWAGDPRRHSPTACKQVFAGLDLLDHLATLRNAPDFREPTHEQAQQYLADFQVSAMQRGYDRYWARVRRRLSVDDLSA